MVGNTCIPFKVASPWVSILLLLVAMAILMRNCAVVGIVW